MDTPTFALSLGFIPSSSIFQHASSYIFVMGVNALSIVTKKSMLRWDLIKPLYVPINVMPHYSPPGHHRGQGARGDLTN